MIDPPCDRPGSHLEFFFNRFNMHIDKWLTSHHHHTTDQDLAFNFKADLACAWSKMIDRGGDCYTKDLLPARVTTCYNSDVDLLQWLISLGDITLWSRLLTCATARTVYWGWSLCIISISWRLQHLLIWLHVNTVRENSLFLAHYTCHMGR